MAPRLKSFLTASKTAGKHNASSQRHACENAGEKKAILYLVNFPLVFFLVLIRHLLPSELSCSVAVRFCHRKCCMDLSLIPDLFSSDTSCLLGTQSFHFQVTYCTLLLLKHAIILKKYLEFNNITLYNPEGN